MSDEQTFTLEEIDKIDSESIDAESANTYSLDDLDRLDSWSEGRNVILDTVLNFGEGFASDFQRIPEQIGTLLKETGERGGAGLAIPSFMDGVSLAGVLTGKDIKPNTADKFFIQAGEMLQNRFAKNLDLQPEEGSPLSKVAYDLGAGAASVASSLGLLYVSRSPALVGAFFGARQKAEIYKESRGALKTPEESSAISAAAGLVEGGVESVGALAFLKGISFNKFITRGILGAANEGLQEAMQQTGEEIITQTTGVRKDTLNNTLMRVGYAAALGTVLGVPAGIVSSSLQKTSIKKELQGYGFSDDQATRIMDKVSEKTIANETVQQEILNFLDEEIKNTESIVKENAAFQSVGAMAADDKFEGGSDIYAQNFQTQQKIKQESGTAKAFEQAGETVSKILEPISTRLKRINPKLKSKLRRYEFDLKQRILEDEKAVKPFLQAFDKLSARDQSDLDLALKNRDKEKINDIIDRNNMTEQYKNVRDTLNALYERGKESDLDIGFLEDYFPRKVQDYEGMLKYWQKQDTWPEMQKRINEKEETLGRKLKDDEKVEMLNSMLKGYKPKGISKPGNIKTREINQVTADLNRFYQKSPQALLQYIYRLNDFLEARRFFGKSAKGSDLSEQTIDASIGQFVLDHLEKGTITGSQAKEVSEILRARFLQKGTSGLVSSIKNLTYIETMGNITSAITQIGDIGFSLYKNGFYSTGKALSKAIAGESLVTKEDLAIERIAEEFADRTKLGKTLETVFKYIGLNWADNLGKETTINAALERLSGLAQDPSPEFQEEIENIFSDESEQVIKDLKTKKTSDNVKFLLFSELADVQPIALSELPEYYLTSGNGRLFYMLKTYTIKMMDVFRNDVFLQMKDNPTKAIGNLVRLTSLLVLANATADIIKDLLLGRPLEWPDYLLNNIWRLVGMSKYSFYKFKTEGVSQGVASVALPPVARFVTNSTKDVSNMIEGKFEVENAEVVQGVPFLGKLYYWWFGGGRAKVEKKAGKKKGFKR